MPGSSSSRARRERARAGSSALEHNNRHRLRRTTPTPNPRRRSRSQRPTSRARQARRRGTASAARPRGRSPHFVDEPGSDDVVLAQARPTEEVLPLQVISERVLWVGPGWHALERVAAELKPLGEHAASRGAPPTLRIRDDGLANERGRLGVRMPYTAAAKDLARADMEVIAGRMGVLGPLVPKMDSEVGLVGASCPWRNACRGRSGRATHRSAAGRHENAG